MENLEKERISELRKDISSKKINLELLKQCQSILFLTTLVLSGTALADTQDKIGEPKKHSLSFPNKVIPNVLNSDCFKDLFSQNHHNYTKENVQLYKENSSYSLDAFFLQEEETAKNIIKLGGMILEDLKEWFLYKIPELKKIEYITESIQTPFSITENGEMNFFQPLNSDFLFTIKFNPRITKTGNQYELSPNSSVSFKFNKNLPNCSVFITKDGVMGFEFEGDF